MKNGFKAFSLRVLIGLMFVVLSSCAHAAQKRIMFVGNSLTGFNNLPGLFQTLAKTQGETPYVESHIEFGRDLQFHGANEKVIAALAKDWDYIVLQEYSVVPLENQNAFLNGVSHLRSLIKSPTAKLVLFQNWPIRDAAADTMEKLDESYDHVALANNAEVVLVGRGVERLRDETSLQVFTDDKHPTPVVTYLAALMFLKEFYGYSPTKFPHTSANANTHYSYHGPATAPSLVDLDKLLSKQDVDFVQRVADEI